MNRYEIRMLREGELTSLPDSHQLFGFLMYCSKKYFSDSDIEQYIKSIQEKTEQCLVSNMMPLGYYPMPKEYILSFLSKRVAANLKIVAGCEIQMEQMKKQLEKQAEEYKEATKDKKSDKKKELLDTKNVYNTLAKRCNLYAPKNIYETVKRMDYILKEDLISLIRFAQSDREVTTENIQKYRGLKMKYEFVQRFRLDAQMNQSPGLPNTAYSLRILTIVNHQEKEQYEFSFFVDVNPGSFLDETLKKMMFEETDLVFLGAKSSVGYNRFRLSRICSCPKQKAYSAKSMKVYLNLGMLLPEFESIIAEDSTLRVHSSDRKPYELEDVRPKIISFVAPGSVIVAKEVLENQEKRDVATKLGKCITNPYNPIYKNAIVFGNSYFSILEVENGSQDH